MTKAHQTGQGQFGILTACPGKISRSPGTLNSPIWSCFECDVTSHVNKVYTYRPNTYTEFIVVRCVFSNSKCTKSIFGPGPRWGLGSLRHCPAHLVGWGGENPQGRSQDLLSEGIKIFLYQLCKRYFNEHKNTIFRVDSTKQTIWLLNFHQFIVNHKNVILHPTGQTLGAGYSIWFVVFLLLLLSVRA